MDHKRELNLMLQTIGPKELIATLQEIANEEQTFFENASKWSRAKFWRLFSSSLYEAYSTIDDAINAGVHP